MSQYTPYTRYQIHIMNLRVNLSESGNKAEDAINISRLSFTITNLILCVPIILLNLFVVNHYRTQYRKFVPCMFFLMSSSDGLMAISVVIESALIIKQYREKTVIEPDTIENKALVVATILWNLFYRVSTFVNAVLCVARTVKVKRPFYKINMKLAVSSVAFYTLLWAAVAVFEYHGISSRPYIHKKGFSMSYGQLGLEIAGIFYKKYDSPNKRKGIKTYYGVIVGFTLNLVPFILPCILSLVCLVILVRSLRKPAPNNISAARKIHVTITVTCITALFVLCTSLSTLYQLVAKIIISLVLEKRINEDVNKYLYPLFLLTLPLVNAAINPLIIVLRSSELKRGLFKLLHLRLNGAQSKRFQTAWYKSLKHSQNIDQSWSVWWMLVETRFYEYNLLSQARVWRWYNFGYFNIM